MELKRYTLIVRRWFWFLIATVACAAFVSWLFLTQTRLVADPVPGVLLVTLAGLAWGLAGIFGIEFLIDNVKTIEDVRRIVPAPVLGTLQGGRSSNGTPFIVFDAPGSPATEVYRSAAHKLLPWGTQEHGRTIFVCSPQATPHAARVGANLAAASALSGLPTLLIDANRGDATLSRALNVAGDPGFVEALADPRRDIVLHLVPSTPNLYVLPAGAPSVPEPFTFTAAHLRAVVERSGAYGSLVVIVGPPLGAQLHGLAFGLAKAADDVVLVIAAESTKRKALKRTAATLVQARANLTGVIFVERGGVRRKESARDAVPIVVAPAHERVAVTGEVYERPSAVMSVRTPWEEEGPTHDAPIPRFMAGEPPADEGAGSRQIVEAPTHGRMWSFSDFNPSGTPPPAREPESGPDLSGLDSLGGARSQQPQRTAAQDLDLSELDSLGGELAREAPAKKPPLPGQEPASEPIIVGPASAPPERRAPQPAPPPRPEREPEPATRATPLPPRYPFEEPPIILGGPVAPPPSAQAPPTQAPREEISRPAPAPVPPGPQPVWPQEPPPTREPIATSPSPAPARQEPLLRPEEPPVAPPAAREEPLAPPPTSAPPQRVAEPAVAARSPSPEVVIPVTPPPAAQAETPPIAPPPVVRAETPARELATVRPSQAPPPVVAEETPPSPGLLARLIAASRARREAQAEERTPRRWAGRGVSEGTPQPGRLQLALAQMVHSLTRRPAEPQEKGQPSATSAQGLSVRQTVIVPESGSELDAWLRAAEDARRRGDYREARNLLDRVLDRDPHNETAWQIRLLLAQVGPAAPPRAIPPPQTAPAPSRASSARRAPLLAGAALLVLLAVAAYVAWPRLSGSPGLSPAPSPTIQAISSTPSASPQPEYELGGKFLAFWGSHGGLPIFGNPISDRMTEFDKSGRQVEVQYFERARFELYPAEGGKEPEVKLGLLGTEVPVSGTVAFPLPEGLQEGEVEIKETRIRTPGKFYAFWERNGGAPIFGYPITPVLIDTTHDGRRLPVQYFERARFEYHADATDPGKKVQLTNLGTLVYEAKYGGR